MSPITTHVLDTARGRPAAGVAVILSISAGTDWRELARGTTDSDGRCRELLPAGPAAAGIYRLTFLTGAYDPTGFFPEVNVVFNLRDPAVHHHVPLLLSPFGFSTYRGS